jgi:hypothetical protein
MQKARMLPTDGNQKSYHNFQPSVATKKLTTRLAFALVSLYLITLVHHIYGGIADGIQARLMVPLIMAAPLLVTLGLLYLYRQSGSRTVLLLFTIIVILAFVILLGIVHSGYSHAYKDILYLLGGPSEWYYRLNPDEHYPPDDLFFEITGVLEIVPSYFIAFFTWQLIRTRHNDQHNPTQVH